MDIEKNSDELVKLSELINLKNISTKELPNDIGKIIDDNIMDLVSDNDNTMDLVSDDEDLKDGDWCWFWDDENYEVPTFAKFKRFIDTDDDLVYVSYSKFTDDEIEWECCERFRGILPIALFKTPEEYENYIKDMK